MKAFDPNYKLLDEMYQDEYYPDFLVDKIKDELQKVIDLLESGETDTEVIQETLDEAVCGINDLQDEFYENDSEIETVARDCIGVTVAYILEWFSIPIDTEEAIRERVARARGGHGPPVIQKPSIARKQHRYTLQGGQVPRRPRRKLRGFRALYVRYLYLLGIRRPPSPKRQPLPFSVRKEVTKLNRYAAQFRLLQAYRIDSAVQLHLLEDALQAEIDALTDRRKELYRQKRRGQEVDGDIQTITRALRPLRSQLRTCGQVERAIPQIRAQERRCRDAMRKEKDHRTETIDKADKARPRKFSLPDR